MNRLRVALGSILIVSSLVALTSCSIKKQIVHTEGSYYRFFSSPADGERRLFISINLPTEISELPMRVEVNNEELPFERISGKAKIEVFISEFKEPKSEMEQTKDSLFLSLAAADELNVEVIYKSKVLLYENVPELVQQPLEMMSAPQ